MKIKKIITALILIIFTGLLEQSFASDDIPYKEIKNRHKVGISADNQTWSYKCSKNDTCYKRTILYNDSQGSVYHNNADGTNFNTDCQFEFINDGSLIGYSNADLNFYRFLRDDEGNITKTPLSYEEVSELFKNFRVIKFSEFSPTTNSLKIKKSKDDLKIILYNDKNIKTDFYDYGTYNAKFVKYPLRGFLKVTRAGMIHFSHYGDNTKDNPMYVILVR